jgi:uncharacterized protein YjbJ (UPF0337 family)
MEYLGPAETKSVPRCRDLHHPRATVKFPIRGGSQKAALPTVNRPSLLRCALCLACHSPARLNTGVRIMGINKDQVEGRVKEVAGKVQEVAGKAAGSLSEQAKGMANQVAGKAQAKFGDAKETVKENYKDEKARQDAQRKDADRRP